MFVLLLYIGYFSITSVEEDDLLYKCLQKLVDSKCFSRIRINLSGICKRPELAKKCSFSGCSTSKIESVEDTFLCRFGKEENQVCRYFDQEFDKDSQIIDLKEAKQIYSKSSSNAGEIWKIIYSKADTFFLENIISGLHYSIFLHICIFFKQMPSGYLANPWYYKKRKNLAYQANLSFAYSYVKSAVGLLSIQNYKCSIEMDTQDFSILNKIVSLCHGRNQKIDDEKINMEFFEDIDNLLNCLECERCKLWGKIQFQGLLVAVKIKNSRGSYNPIGNELICLIHLLYKLKSAQMYIESLERYNYPFLYFLKSYLMEMMTIAFSVALFVSINRFFCRKFERTVKIN